MLARRAGSLRVLRRPTAGSNARRTLANVPRAVPTSSSSRVALRLSTPALLQTESLSYRGLHSSSRALGVQTVQVPNVAESITEGTLRSWNKQVGDHVEADEEVATIETDKVDVSVNAPVAGKIVELLAKEEDTVAVGADLFRIEEGAEGESSSKPKDEPKEEKPKEEEKKSEHEPQKEEPKKEEPKKEEPPKEDKRPEPRKEESKPKPAEKKPSPPSSKDSKSSSSSSTPLASAAPSVPGSRNETRVKMSRMRLRIAERLKESQNAAAFLTTFNEIDMSSIKEFRSLYKDEVLKGHGVKLGYMSAFAKASALALQEIPAANASIEGDSIVYRDYVDLSVAVATSKGLVTPVVRNLETMNFVQIEKSIADLGKKARDSQLTLEDMAGGTFTISNGGVFGSLYGTPIINLPQSAVLGMHSIVDKATVVNGKIEIRPIMVVALTYDHRLLDGREAVTFLVRVKQYIEDPRKMLLV